MPEWIASSTPYWIRGLSTSGSISLGWALVAGRKRVPSPAAGNTALRTLGIIRTIVRAARGYPAANFARSGGPSPAPEILHPPAKSGRLTPDARPGGVSRYNELTPDHGGTRW